MRVLAQAGADVAVHYGGNRKKAEALVSEIQAMGRRAMAVQADITSLSDVMRMKDEIVRTLGNPNIVVNGAVIQCKPWKTVLNTPTEDYVGQFESCVLHNVHMAKAFLPAMIEARAGRFIGINTECAMQMAPTMSAYASAKRGWTAFCVSLPKRLENTTSQ